MKTKATKKSVNLIILMIGILFIQFAKAECPAGKVYACRVDQCGFSDCRCISQAQLQNWLSITPPCGGNHCCRGFRTSSSESTIIESSLEAYPNPVNDFATISLALQRSQTISLKIYDMKGGLIKIIAEGFFEAGNHTFSWDASQASEGFYLLQLYSEDFWHNQQLMVNK
jgi:hypothetical protein